MVDLEELRGLIEEKGIEEAAERLDWSDFEDTVSEIFASNGFRTMKNFRFKTASRFEMDVVAVKNGMAVCADCKHWGKGRSKTAGIKAAALRQTGRVDEFKKFLKGNIIALSRLGLLPGCKAYPLVVTLFEEELVNVEGCLVVPVWKLNSFLLEIEKYLP